MKLFTSLPGLVGVLRGRGTHLHVGEVIESACLWHWQGLVLVTGVEAFPGSGVDIIELSPLWIRRVQVANASLIVVKTPVGHRNLIVHLGHVYDPLVWVHMFAEFEDINGFLEAVLVLMTTFHLPPRACQVLKHVCALTLERHHKGVIVYV